MSQKSTSVILGIIIVVLIGTVAYFSFSKSDRSLGTSSTNSKILVFNSPVGGAAYSKQSDIRIVGKTKPGYAIQVYANYSANDYKCLTVNALSNGGAGQADQSGNFDFGIVPGALQKGSNTVVIAALDSTLAGSINNECFPASNVSEPVSFTYSGPVVSQ